MYDVSFTKHYNDDPLYIISSSFYTLAFIGSLSAEDAFPAIVNLSHFFINSTDLQ